MNLSHDEIIAWAAQRAKSLTDEEKAANAKITIDYFPNQRIEKDVPSSCNCGYLFLQSLYTQLRLDNTCRNIRNRYSFDFDLNSILSDLIFARILLLQANCLPIPSANHCLNRQNMIFIRFHCVLSLLLPKKMTISSLMSTGTVILLFLATTGFSTMTAQTSSSRSKRLMISENTGNPKRNRPNPIVQMGLFMDGDGIPCIQYIPRSFQ